MFVAESHSQAVDMDFSGSIQRCVYRDLTSEVKVRVADRLTADFRAASIKSATVRPGC